MLGAALLGTAALSVAAGLGTLLDLIDTLPDANGNAVLLGVGQFLGLISTLVTECGCGLGLVVFTRLLVNDFRVDPFRLCFTRHLLAATPLLSSTRVLLGILAFREHLEVSSDR